MANMMMFDADLVSELVELVEYAALRLQDSDDIGASKYLEEELTKLRGKISDERFGGGDLTCIQIDRILRLLGGEDG